MNILCTTNFRLDYLKLIKKNSYKGLEKELIDYFFDKTAQQLKAATSLNGPSQETVNPFLKKRLDGRGGFRVYYYVIVDNKIIISAVHPKTGSLGKQNLNPKEIVSLMREAIKEYDDRILFELTNENGRLAFNNWS